MRALVQRSLACVIVGLVAGIFDRVLAQSVAEPEEIIVRGGKSLSQYRLELERARDDLYKLFNESNSGNDTDVQCRNEAPTGSRMPQSVCRTQAEDRADANAARSFLNALVLGSGAGAEGIADTAMSEAVSNAVRAGSSALIQLEDEWRRVLGEDPRFYDAVVDYAKLKEEFDALRGVTSASAQLPLQIPLGPAGPQCEASTLTEFEQRNNVARISGTVSISNCPAGTTGSFTLVTQVRNDAGETRPIEFGEAWQRADAQDHIFNSDYAIGDNVTLTSVRVRNLTCTCEGSAQ